MMSKIKIQSGMKALRAASVSMAVATVLAASALPAQADETSELKAAVEALQKRIDQLEKSAKAVEETNDRQTDQIAQAKSNVGGWVSNFTWKGDFRYRNENIVQQYTPDRNRDRIRVRAGFVAKVNDTIRTEVGLSTSEGNDPRSSNQTLTGENSRKNVFIDLAYAEWQPLPDWKFTVGKMKYPWVRAGQSVFFDGDVNPEGLAANFSHGDFFASSFYNILEERSTVGESTMGGAQFGWRPTIGASKLTLAVSYFDLNSVQNRNPFFSGSNGNTTKTTGCRAGVSPCLVNDYNLLELIGEWSMPMAGRPLALYVDYVKNDAATTNLDTAYSTGVMYGKASDPRTWEIGYYYQNVEKDALYGQYIDSDWGAGNTDAHGHVFKFGYAFAKNWVLNATYQVSKTNMDVPVSISGVGTVFDRDYKRLQVDLNFKY
jgi:hypothetical protein